MEYKYKQEKKVLEKIYPSRSSDKTQQQHYREKGHHPILFRTSKKEPMKWK